MTGLGKLFLIFHLTSDDIQNKPQLHVIVAKTLYLTKRRHYNTLEKWKLNLLHTKSSFACLIDRLIQNNDLTLQVSHHM